MAALAAIAVVAAVGLLQRRESSGGAIATLQTADQHALVFAPDDSNVAYFGHHNGILRTGDGGRTWTPLVERSGFDAMQLASAGRGDPRRLYLAGHDIFQTSSDGGQSWQPVQHNLPGTDIHQFALNPDDPVQLTASVVGQGLLRSGDSGRTWNRLAAQPPGQVTALASAGGSPETLYAGTAGAGVLRSIDEGRTWTPASAASGANPPVRTVLALAMDPSARQTLYAGTDTGLAKSADGGTTWAALPYPGENAVAVAVSPADPRVILAVASVRGKGGLVYRGEDGGLTY